MFSISAPLAVTVRTGQRNTAVPSKDQLEKCPE